MTTKITTTTTTTSPREDVDTATANLERAGARVTACAALEREATRASAIEDTDAARARVLQAREELNAARSTRQAAQDLLREALERLEAAVLAGVAAKAREKVASIAEIDRSFDALTKTFVATVLELERHVDCAFAMQEERASQDAEARTLAAESGTTVDIPPKTRGHVTAALLVALSNSTLRRVDLPAYLGVTREPRALASVVLSRCGYGSAVRDDISYAMQIETALRGGDVETALRGGDVHRLSADAAAE